LSRPPLLLLTLVASALACGDDTSVPDTGTTMPDASVGVPGAAAAPVPPAPRSDVCPSGWVVVDDDRHSYCAGWPSPTPTCTASEALLPGMGCVAIGPACPSGDFPADAPAGAVFVQPGASGDGSRADPVGTIGDALALSAAAIVLSADNHDIGALRLDEATTLIGSCVSGTVLDGSLAIGGSGITLEDLSLRGAAAAAMVVEDAGGVVVTRVIVSTTDAAAIESRGTLQLEDARIEGGLRVDEGDVSLSRVAFVDGPPTEAVEIPAGALDLAGGAVDAEALSFIGAAPGAVRATGGASAALRQLMVEGAGGFGVSMEGEGTSVTVEDIVVRELSAPPSVAAAGFRAIDGAELDVARAVIARVERYGVQFKRGVMATFEDLLVFDTRPRSRDSRQGMGIRVDETAHLSLRRAEVVDSLCAGIRASEAGTVDMEDVVVRDTKGEMDTGDGGFGLRTDTQGSVTARRVRIESSRHAGVLADTLSSMVISDLAVLDTHGREVTMAGGHGVHVAQSSTMELERATIDGSLEAGISLDGPESSLRLRDVVIRDTESSDANGRFGSGLSASGGTVDAARVTIERSRYVGLYVGEGARATIGQLELAGVASQRCADEDCSAMPFGIGLGAFNSGVLTVEEFTVDDSELCGVMVGPEADLMLSDGRVTGALIGACIQANPFDVAQLTSGVMYSENQQNLDTTSLPVPEAAPRIMD